MKFLLSLLCIPFFFFFNDTATTEIYTLSLHDALPIYTGKNRSCLCHFPPGRGLPDTKTWCTSPWRSEEHTSELQSQSNLVCRLLLEKKKKKNKQIIIKNIQIETNLSKVTWLDDTASTH